MRNIEPSIAQHRQKKQRRKQGLWKSALGMGCLWMGVALVWMGCGISLQQARQQEQQGQLDMAEQSYRQIAKQEGTEEAREAQMALVHLLLRREQWRILSGEASRLASFLESDDPWFRQYRSQAAVWKKAQQEIGALLLRGARVAFEKARHQGNPDAYIASGRMYGLYLERFKRGSAVAEAAAGRGVVFASRSDCREALVWFQRAMEWSPGLQLSGSTLPQPAMQPERQDSHPWLVWQAVRGELGCRVQLWLDTHNKQASSEPNPSPSSSSPPRPPFAGVEQAARSFYHRAAFLGGPDILRQSALLERSGAYVPSLRLLLVLAEDNQIPQLTAVAKQRILQIFGQSKAWKSLLTVLEKKLANVPSSRRDLFWHRVQELNNLYQMRKAQTMVQQQQGQSAVQQLLQEYQSAPQQRQVLLYRAALMRETDLRDVAGALTLYQKFLDQHSRHPLAMQTLYRIALLWERQNQTQKAIQFYLRLGGAYPKHPIASRSFYQSYLLYQKLGSLRKAQAMRRHILRRYPTSLAAQRLVSERRKHRKHRKRRK